MPESSPPIHPEWLARAVAADANYRFSVTCADRAWYDERQSGIVVENRPLVRARFDQLIVQYLAEASSGYLVRVPPQRAPAATHVPARATFPPAYVSPSRGRLRVNLDLPPVRSDLDFWWQVSFGDHWRAMLFLSREALARSDFLQFAHGPVRRAIRYQLPASAVRQARLETSDGTRIALVPRINSQSDLELLVVAAQPVAVELAHAVLRATAQRDPDTARHLTRYDPGDPPIDFLGEALKELILLDQSGRGPEAWLEKVLQSGVASRDRKKLVTALGAAQAVAFLEARPPAVGADPPASRRARTLQDAAAWAARQDRLGEELVLLAERVVLSAPVDALVDPALESAEARAAYREAVASGLADLARRLAAAVRGRRIERTAPNARPRPASPRRPEELVRPERWSTLEFFALADDVVELARALRDRADARIAVPFSASDGGELTELAPVTGP
jgi:hypothetical protein